MSKPKVFATKPLSAEVREYLSPIAEIRVWEAGGSVPRDVMLEECREAEGLLVTANRVDRELLESCGKLKIVANTTVGYNNVDIDAAKEKGILVTHTPGVLDDTVADLVLALILTTARRTAELDRYVKTGLWKADSEWLFGLDVHHKKIGIIGLGRIGEAIAKRAALGFSMEVLYHNRHRNEDAEQRLGVRYRSFDQLLAESDFVVLMTPLTPETTDLMGAREFALMKKTAIFINASRGKTVDETALYQALVEKKIWGAGLDVFRKEPVDPANPLLTLDNMVCLPHIGSATAATRIKMAVLAAENLAAGLQGKTPPNLVPELRA